MEVVRVTLLVVLHVPHLFALDEVETLVAHPVPVSLLHCDRKPPRSTATTSSAATASTGIRRSNVITVGRARSSLALIAPFISSPFIAILVGIVAVVIVVVVL
jgi:hypothetical protein